jgi:NADPH-dependent curcumin reductase CurA
VEFFAKMSVRIKETKIQTKDSVTVGIENTATYYVGMLTGQNFGKTVLKIADLE